MYKQTLKAIMALLFSGPATIGLAGNDTMLLHSGWKFRQAGHSEWHPATVPGVVHTDLMDNGLIEDPYYRLNERSLQWIDKEDWIYEVSFDAGRTDARLRTHPGWNSSVWTPMPTSS